MYSKTDSYGRARDTGLALVLLSLLIIYFTGFSRWLPVPISLLVVSMLRPIFFKPLAKLWLGLSVAIGIVMSNVILTVIFFTVVTPVGLIRKVWGADSMQLNRWKKDDGSIFKIRIGKVELKDLEQPY